MRIFGGIRKLRGLTVNELFVGSYRNVHSWDLTEPIQYTKDDIRIRVLAYQKKYISALEMVTSRWSYGLQTRYREPFQMLYPRY